MQIKQLAATFGRLENETLSLLPGLNVIEAPNEGGKSTWTAFLRVMLYGLNTRDRSPNADKRRYMPWSGSAMEGRLDAFTSCGDVTVLRRTARASSPMGAFSAVYTGTSEPVESLTSANCGEVLLGVPQEVYERSAYIRQSRIAVDQSAALERRIAALITTGEEDVSYTDATDRLRKQLNRRQSNRSTGLIPQLDQEIAALRAPLDEIALLEERLRRNMDRRDQLLAQRERLQRQLSLHDAADRAQQALQLQHAKAALEQAQEEAAAARRDVDGLPALEELEALRSAADALEAVDRAASGAQQQTQTAADRLGQAEAVLSAHPLSGHTPEEAAHLPLGNGPRPRLSPLPLCLSLLVGIASAAAMLLLQMSPPAAVAAGLGAAVLLALLCAVLPLRRRQRDWDTDDAERRRQRQEQLSAYTILYEKAASARAAQQAAQAACLAVSANQADDLAALLTQVHRFQPAAADLPAARRAIEGGIGRWAALECALRSQETSRMRWELLSHELPAPSAEQMEPAERPRVPRRQLQEELEEVSALLQDLQRQIHTAQGRVQALGDPLQLQTELRQREDRRETLQREYDAIALAMDVLSGANTALQTRFSPALGEKSAKIFTKLTRGKYNRVLLDRNMTPSAQEAGQILPREAALLSQGASDQLYLAVRLAVCDMVLPAEQAAPILLDDALVSFDDSRMAAALDCLVELAQQRQILLFTCQRREADYLHRAHPGQYHKISL